MLPNVTHILATHVKRTREMVILGFCCPRVICVSCLSRHTSHQVLWKEGWGNGSECTSSLFFPHAFINMFCSTKRRDNRCIAGHSQQRSVAAWQCGGAGLADPAPCFCSVLHASNSSIHLCFPFPALLNRTEKLPAFVSTLRVWLRPAGRG